MLIEIVTHCWRYSRVLTWQLSSLFLHPPKDCLAIATVYYSPADAATAARLNWFYDLWKGALRRSLSNVLLLPRPLERTLLLNRAIGRNRAARVTQADAVWFADADYCFGPGCLDAAAEAVAGGFVRDNVLYWPGEYHLQKSKESGDGYARLAVRPGLYDVLAEEFARQGLAKAIGGVQIVAGKTARDRGYCPEEKWQQPREAWSTNTREDVNFRKRFVDRRPLALPNLYRIRQTHPGRVDALEAEVSTSEH